MEHARLDLLAEKKLIQAFRRLTEEDRDTVLYLAVALGEYAHRILPDNVVTLFQDLI